MKLVTVLACAAIAASVSRVSCAAHPEILTTPADLPALREKLASAPWAKEAYAAVHARVDKYVAFCDKDPHWLTSRLCLNWQTHYTTDVVKNEKWVGGEGHAPIPTPRFGGERNWATNYSAPSIEDLTPYNDDNGKIKLINKNTGKPEWVEPGATGRIIEAINERILSLASDASFLYQMTGDERYARVAADVLCTYMDGFAYVTPPKVPADEPGTAKIIGFSSFEVIHEGVMPPLGLTYDFLHDYLVKKGEDIHVIQSGLKRMADRVIAGGIATANWNLNQAINIIYAILPLDDDAAYPDRHGRQYYVDVLLNARLPNQTGLTHVIEEGYDPQTALWPEAPGYGFGTTPQMIEMATLLQSDPAGRALLDDPRLTRAALAQFQLLYPDGFSVGVGDTYNTRITAPALELLIAHAREIHDDALETQLTARLEQEIEEGNYDRDHQASLLALTHYVAAFKPVAHGSLDLFSTYFAKPLDIVMQRSDGDRNHAIVAALFGTDGGHVHANGMAIELYGAGAILGADPGRGTSYWTKDHGEYYSQPEAHNTVIIDARSTYPVNGPKHESMSVDAVDPPFEAPRMSPTFTFAQGSFHYQNPVASQRRTLATIRLGDTAHCFLDVFRSRTTDGQNHFQDYLYHNIGQSLSVVGADGGALLLQRSNLLASTPNVAKGYGYFHDEDSAVTGLPFHADFTVEGLSGGTRHMAFWMNAGTDRRLFRVAAPSDRAGRPWLPKSLVDHPMPTLILRQNNPDAWSEPFVAVYEPYMASDGPSVTAVKTSHPEGCPGVVVCEIQSIAGGNGSNTPTQTTVIDDDEPGTERKIGDITYNALLAATVQRESEIEELYLGTGTAIAAGAVSISGATTLHADLRFERTDWRYSSTAPAQVSVTFPGISGVDHYQLIQTLGGKSEPVKDAEVHVSDANQVVVHVTLPAMRDAVLGLHAGT